MHDLHWSGDWDYRFAGLEAHRRVAALWRDCHRSTDFRRCDTTPGWGSAAGLLHSVAAGHARGPHGRLEIRIARRVSDREVSWNGPRISIRRLAGLAGNCARVTGSSQ